MCKLETIATQEVGNIESTVSSFRGLFLRYVRLEDDHDALRRAWEDFTLHMTAALAGRAMTESERTCDPSLAALVDACADWVRHEGMWRV